MRQEQHQAVLLAPLVFCGGKELVDDDLSAVGEVAELCLPNGEGFRAGQGVAVVKAQYRVLAEVRIVDGKAAFFAGNCVHQAHFLLGIFHLNDGVAVGEGAALDVLPGDAHVETVAHQRSVGQHFRQPPVYGVRVKEHAPTVLHQTRSLVEELLAVGELGQGSGHCSQIRRGQGGVHRKEGIAVACGRIGCPLVQHERRDDVFLNGLGLGEIAFQHGAEFGFHFLHQSGLHLALRHQFLVVDLARVGVFGDFLVEQRLRETGLVAFVVAVLAVAQKVNEDIAAVLLAVFHRKTHGVHAGFHVVTVDVQNGSQNGLGHVRAVGGRAGVQVVGGEAHLVVDDQVDGAAGGVAVQAFHLQDLVHNALTGHRGVAVDEDGQHLTAVHAVVRVSLGAGNALHHRIYRLQVGRIGR